MRGYQWSYSDWQLFNRCKKAYEFKKIKGIKTESNYLQSKGVAVHALAEEYVKGNIKGMPKELSLFADEFNQLRDVQADTEIDLAVTEKWQPTVWDDWNNVWCRAKADVGTAISIENRTALVVDYKWGKQHDSHVMQGHLYATLAFSHFDVEEIRIEFWYLKDGKRGNEATYTADMWPKMRAFWKGEVMKMRATQEFPECEGAGPDSFDCKWCNYSKDNGGPCRW